MSDRLVICSCPEDDDYVGEQHNADFVNITETSLDEVSKTLNSSAYVRF